MKVYIILVRIIFMKATREDEMGGKQMVLIGAWTHADCVCVCVCVPIHVCVKNKKKQKNVLIVDQKARPS